MLRVIYDTCDNLATVLPSRDLDFVERELMSRVCTARGGGLGWLLQSAPSMRLGCPIPEDTFFFFRKGKQENRGTISLYLGEPRGKTSFRYQTTSKGLH